jgi:hypothetical protein
MTKILGKSVLILAAVLSLSSCKKWLDLQPQDGITGAEFWKTKEQVQSAVFGIYAALTGPAPSSNTSAVSESFFMWGELRADMVAATLGTTSEQNDIINVNILPTNRIANWRGIYQVINYCNTVIDLAPPVLQQDATFTQAALDRYLSEAKTIRALMYFYLARTFGDVPLKIKATLSDREIEQIAKSSQQDVLAQVLKDLGEAEPLSVTTHGDQASDKGRVTKYTVYAIQADVNLWMNNYDACIAACNKLTSSGKFGLIDGSSAGTWYNILFVSGNSNESIFELQFDRQRLNPYYPVFMTSGRRLIASPTVMDDMYQLDLINPLNVDIRGDGAALRSSDNVIWKYVGISNSDARAAEESYAHWIFYRYADILLMKAEALNQKGNGQQALDIVYQIRARGRALPGTDLAPSASDKDGVADFILAERARELAFEGKRWYDLLRNAKRDNYRRLGILLNLVSSTVPPDRQQSAINKFRDSNCHYLPIFSYELETDKLLVQNPFYR